MKRDSQKVKRHSEILPDMLLPRLFTFYVSRLLLERAMGFEPTTASLEGWNSTTELRPHALSVPSTESSVLSSETTPRRRIQHSGLATQPWFQWWAGKDSNLGSRWQQIYSLPPLATWVPARNTLHATQTKKSGVLTIAFFFIRMMKDDEKRKASQSTHGSPILTQ